MPPMTEEGKLYELSYLLTPLVAPEAVAETVEQEIKRRLLAASAAIKHEMPPRLRTLAYPIKKVVEHKGSIFREAYFGSIVFRAAPAAVVALEAELEKSPIIIRHLLIILPARAVVLPARSRSPAQPATAPTALPAETTGKKMTTAAIDEEINQLLAASQ